MKEVCKEFSCRIKKNLRFSPVLPLPAFSLPDKKSTIPAFFCKCRVDGARGRGYNGRKRLKTKTESGCCAVKTTVKDLPYAEVQKIPLPPHVPPRKPGIVLRSLIRGLSAVALAGTKFQYTAEGMEQVDPKEPCLIFMNHSCFLDLSIASRIFYPRPYAIVCTSDGFVGMHGLMNRLMRAIGCFPTKKFVTDLQLVQDLEYCLKKLKISVLMYPEASYSFDGTATPLPRKMGVLLKKLGVPLVMVETFGAFSRNPLYNELQVRKAVPVSARVRCLYTAQQIREKTVQELSDGLDAAFSFDHFRWQREQNLAITDPFRADGLERILYKCPACGAEGKTKGKGTALTCGGCGKTYTLTPLGALEAREGETEFPHIPDWYAWERQEVRREIEAGTYRMEAEVDIAVMRDYRAIYRVGSGRLTHSCFGFTLEGCDGTLHYTQPPQACYGLYADYYWYEIGDMVCIGDQNFLYYCFPKTPLPVAKVRLAAEELYKRYKAQRRK